MDAMWIGEGGLSLLADAGRVYSGEPEVLAYGVAGRVLWPELRKGAAPQYGKC